MVPDSEVPVTLPLPGPLATARFVRRRLRFLIDVEGPAGPFTAHANNTGSMLGLLRPGRVVGLSVSDNPKRKLAHTLEMVRLPDFRGDFWVGVNTLTPNRLFRKAFLAGAFADLAGYDAVRPEPAFARGRLDFALSGPAGECFVECKNVTMVEDGTAMFPDAATLRGCKHLVELTRLAREGRCRAALFFCVQRPDGDCFAPAEIVDPDYAALLRQAVAAGVLVLAYRATASPEGISLGERLPLSPACLDGVRKGP
ncbi:DNA/RNA nuclease SfsA [Solidesulfovibrio sp.]|uniref:DNA/RNA nuclease SfsA n=1 Tax=Solidesulfovibrio sp. TaxID=2910990 RepID=UPI00262B3526|nr:DNA/RNA nuclease SfsA [Solidesulfovibrio sp.]